MLKTTERYCDKKAITNEKINHAKKLQPNAVGSYEDVKAYKEYTDMQDKFLIYDVNQTERYVFKTSNNKLNIRYDEGR